MPTLENFDARSLALDFSPLLQIQQALDVNKNRDLAERKLQLDEEIRRGTLDVAQAELILKQEAGDLAGRKFEAGQASQQSIQETLSQLINPTQAPAGQVDPGQADNPLTGELGFFQNPDGSTSSEVSFTEKIGDRFFNFPSLVKGQIDPSGIAAGKDPSREQMRIAVDRFIERGGLNLPGFATNDEAIIAARARSDAGGSTKKFTSQPRTQPVPEAQLRKREALLLKLAGTKGGGPLSKTAESIFAGRDERAKIAFAKEIKDKKRFALSLKRAGSREAQNRIVENEITKQSRTPGGVDPALKQFRNMSNADREQELFLDIAHGDVLDDLAKNELIPPVIKPVSETSAVKNAKALGLVPGTTAFNDFVREKSGGSQITVSAFQEEGEKLGARSDAKVRDEIRGNARAASRQLGRIRSLGKLLEQTGTGALTQFLPDIARLIPGIDASNEQAASAQINSFILDEMAKFKGSTSDRELNFASQTVQQLGNTPEANRMILRNFENVIFLSQQENRQFDAFTKGEGKPRDFIFNFQEVIFPNHPTFGNVTLDDIQTTALENKITMERTIQEMRKR